MKLTREDVTHVAKLARLDLSEESIDMFVGQIGNILEYMETLNQVDTEDVESTSHAIFLTNAFREDEEQEHLDRENSLANAPEKEDGSFLVPKVIG